MKQHGKKLWKPEQEVTDVEPFKQDILEEPKNELIDLKKRPLGVCIHNNVLHPKFPCPNCQREMREAELDTE